MESGVVVEILRISFPKSEGRFSVSLESAVDMSVFISSRHGGPDCHVIPADAGIPRKDSDRSIAVYPDRCHCEAPKGLWQSGPRVPGRTWE